VGQLIAAIERAAALVGQILSFSRQIQADTCALDLGPLVKEAVKLVKASLPPTIEVHVEVPDREFTVQANPAQMHQVVLNLLSNAHHAMARSGGRLVVTLEDVALGSEERGELTSLPAGAYRVLQVSDTGCGMDARTVERVFDPFFTTKPMGKGTGQGLTVAHSVIVQKHDGSMDVESEVGVGSTFRVRLPLHLPDPEEGAES
jgi:signal transduction histidine kinase